MIERWGWRNPGLKSAQGKPRSGALRIPATNPRVSDGLAGTAHAEVSLLAPHRTAVPETFAAAGHAG